MESPALLIGPVVVILALLLLPFVFGEGEKSWRRRPTAVLTILLAAVSLGTFTRLAEHTPWSPVMDAWSGIPIPSEFLDHRTALERQGALVFQVKQCHNCHSLDNQGGKRGPTLDAVAVRLTPDRPIRQVIQGGGHLPAYGKNLSPAETTALVAFIQALPPAGPSAARDPARANALGSDTAAAASSRPPTVFCPQRRESDSPLESGETGRAPNCQSCVLLARCGASPHRMACPRGIPTGATLELVARNRARVLLGCWASILV